MLIEKEVGNIINMENNSTKFPEQMLLEGAKVSVFLMYTTYTKYS